MKIFSLLMLWHSNISSNKYMAQMCDCLFPDNGFVNFILNHVTFPHKSIILCISVFSQKLICIWKIAL